MTAVDVWLPFVDAYADGSLEDRDALRLRLAAESSAELREAIREASAFHAALAAMPAQAPGPDFDARVMATIPLERYASAPRRRTVSITLGQLAPSFVQRWVVRLGKGLSALAAAWVVALAVGSTALQAQISAGAAGLGARLQHWAEQSTGTPVLAQLAAALSGAYDASHGALGSVAGALGLGLTIFVIGALVGALALWMAARRRVDRSARISDPG